MGKCYDRQGLTVQVHYVPEVSVNALFPRQIRRLTQARKRAMSSNHCSYAELKNIFSEHLYLDLKVSESSIPNMKSALDAFIKEQGFTDTTVIGSTLRASYYKARDKHLAALRARGQPGHYVSNRRVLLGKWRAALLELDRRSTVARNELSPFQSALKELVAQSRGVKGTARACGMPLATLRRWLSGAVPNGRSIRWVAAVERVYALPRGTLGDLLPERVRLASVGTDAAQAAPRIEFRERQQAQANQPYALHEPSESLRAEWKGLVAFKTAFGQYRRWGEGKALQRQPSGRWKTTRKYVQPEGPGNWYAFQSGASVPTAGINWGFISQYLGWLCLAPESGGLGLPSKEVHTLGHLAHGEYVERFVQWRIDRSGGIVHAGVMSILLIVRSLTHPQTGYLTQSCSIFGQKLGVTSEDVWRARCQEAYEAARAKIRDYRPVQTRSRDPFAPIKGILDLPNPLEAVADAVRRMDAQRPTTGGIAEAVWARDRLLVKLLASNPLRKQNLQLLTYRADGTGHLRKDAEGWRVCIDKSEFKNAAGAAKDRVYQMLVRPEVWPDIERYLTVYRPMLADAGNPHVFIGTDSRSGPWKSLGRQFASITKRYFDRCPGVGPQSMRHIVATSILKARPNDWATAAWALHDLEETVRKNYAHLRSDDAVRWMDPAFAGPFSRM
jgi:integrase